VDAPTPRHSVSVAAVVVDEHGRALAIRRRDNQQWEPPGGVLELDEAVHEGLIREVREETGLTVEPGPLTGVYKNLHLGIVALVFRCSVDSGRASSTGEAAEVRWLEEEAIHQHMDAAYAVRMLDALRGGQVQMRAHDGASVIEARR
jgi:ADP-ribose pyrophosphatase YjhB (NUDIX family)